MLTDQMLDDIINSDHIPNIIPVREMSAEIIRLRRELARFEGVPSTEDFTSVNISVGGGESKAKLVADWLTKVIAGGGEG